jgi:gephyrin
MIETWTIRPTTTIITSDKTSSFPSSSATTSLTKRIIIQHQQIIMSEPIPSSTTASETSSSVILRPRQSQWPAISMEDALKIVVEIAQPIISKSVPANLVRPGMVLYEPVIAKNPIPPARTSIKDGYAVIASDGIGDREVITVTTAGSITTLKVTPGTCARVSTGAMIPAGADAVVQVEDTELIKHNNIEEQIIRILKPPKENQDIREIGSDVSIGQILLEKRCILGSAEIGIIAASGQRFIEIYRKPKVCVMSTGNELIDWTAEETPEGKIRDTNRPQLLALLNVHGFKTIDGGIVGDTREQLIQSIKVAFKFSNVIVMSGGVSMGEKDLVKSVLKDDFGFTIHFGRVFMKPGLPSTFATGTFENNDLRYIFAVPGNPVSAWVACQLFAIPALRKLGGYQNCFQTEIKVRLAEQIRLDLRPEYRRAWLSNTDNSDKQSTISDNENIPLAFCTSHNQLSSFILSTRGANLLLKLPSKTESQQFLKSGDIVSALVIGQL